MGDAQKLVDTLVQAIATGDTGPLEAVTAADAVVWHNTDRKELTSGEALAGIAMLQHIASNTGVDVRALHETATGFVLEVVLRGNVTSHGGPIELHNCIVVTVEDGLITRMDEYVDPNGAAQFAPPAS